MFAALNLEMSAPRSSSCLPVSKQHVNRFDPGTRFITILHLLEIPFKINFFVVVVVDGGGDIASRSRQVHTTLRLDVCSTWPSLWDSKSLRLMKFETMRSEKLYALWQVSTYQVRLAKMCAANAVNKISRDSAIGDSGRHGQWDCLVD